MTLKKISNWKTPGHAGIHGFWYKKFTSIYDRQELEINRCLQEANVTEWVTKRKAYILPKTPPKWIATSNNRPITCQPILWKILTAKVRKNINYSLTSQKNKKHVVKEPETQESNSTILSTSWMTARWDVKSSYGLDWLQIGICDGPTKLDNKLLEM